MKNFQVTTGVDTHIYDMSAHKIQVIHWADGDRYTVQIANVTFYLSAQDYRGQFAPMMIDAMNNPTVKTV